MGSCLPSIAGPFHSIQHAVLLACFNSLYTDRYDPVHEQSIKSQQHPRANYLVLPRLFLFFGLCNLTNWYILARLNLPTQRSKRNQERERGIEWEFRPNLRHLKKTLTKLLRVAGWFKGWLGKDEAVLGFYFFMVRPGGRFRVNIRTRKARQVVDMAPTSLTLNGKHVRQRDTHKNGKSRLHASFFLFDARNKEEIKGPRLSSYIFFTSLLPSSKVCDAVIVWLLFNHRNGHW